MRAPSASRRPTAAPQPVPALGMPPACRPPCAPLPVPGRNGFTLVEMLVALAIFGMIAAAAVSLLSFSVRAQDAADERLAGVAELRRLGSLLTADLAQAAPRPHRDEAGRVRPAFAGEATALALVRRGWDNPAGAARPSLQRVEYRLSQGRLERLAFTPIDGAAAPMAAPAVDGVLALKLRYRDREGQWRERWDPTQVAELPVAVELVAVIEERGAVRQLFLAGTGQER